VPGNVPEPGSWPTACRFAPRCDRAVDACSKAHPELVADGTGRKVRCYNPELQAAGATA
jgi:peptide/nickel transport system ATP-binding protein